MKSSTPRHGRGAVSNAASRYSGTTREAVDDGWFPEEPAALATQVGVETSRSVIARNQSPDLPFDQSLNPYRGCEHGCIYCYARPSHAYLGLSPGLDFETRLFTKPDAPQLLEKELAHPNYRCSPLALGANTDPYQPIERQWRITRQVLEVLQRARHPVTITTKSALIERDLDILGEMAAAGLANVQVSITTLDKALALKLEPRASAPHRRLLAVARLAAAGVPVKVMIAPVIPWLTDSEMERIVEKAAEHAAVSAGYILLRLPREVESLFAEWLNAHYPLKAAHTLSLVTLAHGGKIYDSSFGRRQVGSGDYAGLLARRFLLALKRHGLTAELPALDAGAFRAPEGKQLDLFR
ncbi:PA0069 family radical SAM protein [Methylococcus geothermalis]|uniref:PA0069 family radical SAM protein n=1 Tax=Methylococcus geothermalis TaxID=2681310 RepID=A0A858Q6Z6_9GAMM|nr:PA0069 family radical SAM protein [Methylococcus geothermalis]QJD29619.1 PA0069 family radical SAM protein [Methylococcus geothermalis]